MPRNLKAANVMELLLVLSSLTFALPMSIALFEQRASLKREVIDEHLREVKPKDVDTENQGKEFVDTFYFNKGL